MNKKIKTAKQVFDFYPGIWKIVRHIRTEDRRQDAIGSGYAIFIIAGYNPNLIFYLEKVVTYYLKSNSTHMGSQRYQYLYDMASSSLFKYFSDGRLFYRFNLGNNQINGLHLCMRDKYVANYFFEEDYFRIVYSVNGPLKSYSITSLYTKVTTHLPHYLIV